METPQERLIRAIRDELQKTGDDDPKHQINESVNAVIDMIDEYMTGALRK